MDKLAHAMRFHLANWIPKNNVPIGYMEFRIGRRVVYEVSFAGRCAKNGNLSGLFYKNQEMKYLFGTLERPTYDILELQVVSQSDLEFVPDHLLKALRHVAETGIEQTLKGQFRW